MYLFTCLLCMCGDEAENAEQEGPGRGVGGEGGVDFCIRMDDIFESALLQTRQKNAGFVKTAYQGCTEKE